METYRLYCLDGLDKVASAQWIEAEDDPAAIEAAEGMHHGRKCELWRGNRLVARLDTGRESRSGPPGAGSPPPA